MKEHNITSVHQNLEKKRKLVQPSEALLSVTQIFLGLRLEGLRKPSTTKKKIGVREQNMPLSAGKVRAK